MQPQNSANQNPVRQSVLRSFPGDTQKKSPPVILVASLLVVLAGVGTGWLLSGAKGESSSTQQPEGTSVTQTSTEAGVVDTSKYPDEAEGVLVEGGIEGEGTHHLEREGGPSKNVYLTSTVIDLQSFVGKKVHVWGETMSATAAGWLMDVGKIKAI
jgi:hypothetical protein